MIDPVDTIKISKNCFYELQASHRFPQSTNLNFIEQALHKTDANLGEVY